jgi:hypothetical protein
MDHRHVPLEAGERLRSSCCFDRRSHAVRRDERLDLVDLLSERWLREPDDPVPGGPGEQASPATSAAKSGLSVRTFARPIAEISSTTVQPRSAIAFRASIADAVSS